MRIRKNDCILIGSILAIALLSFGVYFFFFQKSESGDMVTVTVDGALYATLPLSNDTTLTVHSGNGGENVLLIQNGQARITEASCPDLLCVHQKAISHRGESLVCLPNQVIVTVTSSKEEPHLDGVALLDIQQ